MINQVNVNIEDINGELSKITQCSEELFRCYQKAADQIEALSSEKGIEDATVKAIANKCRENVQGIKDLPDLSRALQHQLKEKSEDIEEAVTAGIREIENI